MEPKQKFETLLSLFEEGKDKQRHSTDFSVNKNGVSPQVPPRTYSLFTINGQQQPNSISTNEGFITSPSNGSNMGVNNRPLSTSIDLLRNNGNKESMNKPLRPVSSSSTSPTHTSVQYQNEELIREIKNERAAHQQTKYLLKSLQAENQKLTSDCSLWRAKYYKLLTKNTKLKVIFDHFQTVMNESDGVPGENSLAQSNGNSSSIYPNNNNSNNSNSTLSTPPRKTSLVNGGLNNNNSNSSVKDIDIPLSASSMVSPSSTSSPTPHHSSHHQRNTSSSSASSYSSAITNDDQKRGTYSHSERTRRPTISASTFFSQPMQNRTAINSSFVLNNGEVEFDDISEEEYYDMLEKRRQISLQILQTEQEYASYLNIIVEQFLNPLKVECYQSNNPFINSIQVKQLFGDIEVILGSSKLLAEDLENVLCDGTTNPVGLGDVFLKICDYFKLYSPYVKNYYTSISVLNKLKEESHKFQTFIQEKEQILLDNNFTDLGALLVLPVSRIGQYTSMINVLFGLTPQTHPDYEPFRNAVIKMKSIVDYVKEKIRDNESQNKVRIIQNQMVGKFENLNLPHRRYVKEGILTEGSKNSNSNATQYYCFLFNDIFVLSTPIKKSGQYSFKKKISFIDAEVSMVSDAEDRPVFQISIPLNDHSSSGSGNGNSKDQDSSPNMLSLNGISNAITQMTESKSSKNEREQHKNQSIINSSNSVSGTGLPDDFDNEREVFVFVADSNRDREEWIQAIQANINMSKKKNDNRKPDDIEKGGIDFSTSEIRLCEQIGSGGSGCTVHRCTVDGFTCAVKVLKLKNTSPYLVEQFVSEINIMVKLNHQNIAKYLGHRLTQNQLWLFMEFYPYSLKDIITKRTSPFPATEVIWIALEIAKGLEFLHNQKPPIIHRDLKPGNIMCSLDDKNRVCNIRVCDFDTSKELGSGVTLKTCIGTPCYMAAEVLNVADENVSGYSLKADIWSFCMLVIEVLSLMPPYHQFQHLQSIEMIISGTPPPLPTNLIQPKTLQPLIELLITCIDLNPSRRPTASQLVQKLTKMLKNSGMMNE